MYYRAILYDPEVPLPERPIQEFFHLQHQTEKWADEQLSRASAKAVVWVYKIEETLKGTFVKKGEAA